MRYYNRVYKNRKLSFVQANFAQFLIEFFLVIIINLNNMASLSRMLCRDDVLAMISAENVQDSYMQDEES